MDTTSPRAVAQGLNETNHRVLNESSEAYRDRWKVNCSKSFARHVTVFSREQECQTMYQLKKSTETMQRKWN